MFHYVYKVQCLVDGSAYFGVKITPDINWGENPNFFALGIRPTTRKFQAKVQKVGMKPWRLTILLCTTEKELAERDLNKILADTKGHPLSLNYDEDAHMAALANNQIKATAAAVEVNTGTPRPPEVKKKISKAMKKHMEKQAAANAAAGKPEAPLTPGTSGMRWIHNAETNEEMMIYIDEDIITGFTEGRLPKE